MHANDADFAANHYCERRTRRNVLMKRCHRAAIDARAALQNQGLRFAAAFGKAGEIEEFVKPQRVSRLRLRRKQIGLTQCIKLFQPVSTFIMPECPAIATGCALYACTKLMD